MSQAQGRMKAMGVQPKTKAVRAERDFYPTPRPATELLLRMEGHIIHRWGEVVEPCAGNGAMVDVLREAGLKVQAFDIEPQRADIISRDLNELLVLVPKPVVTNPPFSLVSQRNGRVPFLETFLFDYRMPYVALLLPATWMWAQGRHGFLRDYPPARVIPIVPRVDWDGRGSPATDHAWHIWSLGHVGPTSVIIP